MPPRRDVIAARLRMGPRGKGQIAWTIARGKVDNVVASAGDFIAIQQLLALHGHLIDGHEFSRLGEVFTADVVYDVSATGQGIIRGLDDFRNLSAAFIEDERNPVGHHVTNVVVEEVSANTAAVRSKGIGVLRSGFTGSVTYLDRVVRTTDGWRIAERRIVVRPNSSEPHPGGSSA